MVWKKEGGRGGREGEGEEGKGENDEREARGWGEGKEEVRMVFEKTFLYFH